MGMIRLLLAFAVFNSHFPMLDLPIVNGHEAVLTFFAISGFYMALILDTSYTFPRSFYLSRFLTLYPIYAIALTFSVALVVSFDIHPMTSAAELSLLLSDPKAFLLMVWTSFGILGQELLFSIAPAKAGGLELVSQSRNAIWHHAPLIQGWSLSLEIMFYALAPYLVRMKNTTLWSLIAISIALKLGLVIAHFDEIVFFKRFFLTEFWLFSAGIMSYRFYRGIAKNTHPADTALIIPLTMFILFADDVPTALKPYALPTVVLATMPCIFRGFRHLNFDRIIGKISYPFYLLHFSFIAIFEMYMDEPSGWQILMTTLCAAFVTHSTFAPGLDILKRKIVVQSKVSYIS